MWLSFWSNSVIIEKIQNVTIAYIHGYSLPRHSAPTQVGLSDISLMFQLESETEIVARTGHRV